ncbi:hypothetical protein PAHAL_9G405400 [Panicum hallii]|uniref:Uncharacterized protein n=1 Tax=Panicum hallii TaxID=206008 RepID=A0A2T8I480_9POAL|nr:hypothetical protein PAHAL_9G405400 [Panicum hallii]
MRRPARGAKSGASSVPAEQIVSVWFASPSSPPAPPPPHLRLTCPPLARRPRRSHVPSLPAPTRSPPAPGAPPALLLRLAQARAALAGVIPSR